MLLLVISERRRLGDWMDTTMILLLWVFVSTPILSSSTIKLNPLAASAALLGFMMVIYDIFILMGLFNCCKVCSVV